MPRSATLALLALLPLAACGLPSTVHVNASAAADLNPGPGGTAFPAQVRLYLLRTPEKFSNADYFQLADHEATVLGSDLIGRSEVILHPRETQTVNLPTKPDGNYLGVAVAFRNINTATWRAVTPIRGTIQLTLMADRVTLAPK